MMVLEMILLGFLIACAIAATIQKNLVTTVLIYMSYSLIMSVIWIVLESPDLAGTEAAVGAGVTTILFFVALKKVGQFGHLKAKKEPDDKLQNVREETEEKGEDDA